MPEPAPVIRAVLPTSLDSMTVSFHERGLCGGRRLFYFVESANMQLLVTKEGAGD
jgi:hypothetical protein